MSVILGIETATDVCAVAVDVDGSVVCAMRLDRPRRHAERLVPMMEQALRASGLSPGDLDAVAVSAGPGSYTGLRIGVSTAKGVSVATGAELRPVPSLQALALASAAGAGVTVLAAFRSRRSEVYAAAFRIGDDGLPAPIGGPAAGRPQDVLPGLAAGDAEHVILVGDGAALLHPVLAAEGVGCTLQTASGPSATAVVRLARTAHPVDADRFEPYYLREFTARPASGSVYDRLPF